MNKMELKMALMDGLTINHLFQMEEGDMCMIYKAHNWDGNYTDEIVYIPDLYETPIDEPLDEEEIEDIITSVYTGTDVLYECNNNSKVAKLILDTCWWSSVNSALDDYLICSEPVDLVVEAGIPFEEAVTFFN